ncbi:MAG TPA: iron-siderophore ABC transporter substrate-binding protein [Paenalcaligenes sp.]|nr:iron-siderophore ABC transporter substrate-binding protein [Paenalcaligenes sp.]
MRSHSRRRFVGHIFSALAVSLSLSALLLGANMAHAQNERQLDTVYGTVTVSGQPERVVVLDEGALDTALSVGVQPIAALASRGGTDVADYLQQYVTEPIEIVGTVREPNIEAIFRLRPDLILASSETNEALYKKLSRIAPTVVPDSKDTFSDWKATVRLFGDALDKEDELEKILAELDQQLEAMHAYWQTPQTVSVVRWNPQGPILMSSKLFTGQLIQAAGLNTLPLADDLGERPHSDTLSLENLVQIDADWLLLASLTSDGEAALIEAQKQPVFQRLSAVQNDQVKVVDGQVWSSGYGPLAAAVIIQDLSQLAAQ